MVFLINVEGRSVIYNIYTVFALFCKLMMGLHFYGEKSFTKLRFYFILRYVFNAVGLGLATSLFDLFSMTYT